MAFGLSPRDTLIAAPLIPLAPIVVTWWLPWERWIPWGKLPRALLGPYLLYVSFAAQHFQFGWFIVTVLLVIGACLSTWAAFDGMRTLHWRIVGQKGPWAAIQDDQTIVYWQEWRKLTIIGQKMSDEFKVYEYAIVAWDDGRRVIDEEKTVILANVRSLLKSQGIEIALKN